MTTDVNSIAAPREATSETGEILETLWHERPTHVGGGHIMSNAFLMNTVISTPISRAS